MQEWIKILLTGAVSLSVALILRYKDRKEAAKIRKDDLEKAAKKREEDREWITKQFAESQEQTIALKEQAKSTKDLAKWSEEHIKILLDNKRVQDLGTPLSIYARESNLVTPDKWTRLSLCTKNESGAIIHVLNIKLKDDSPFILGYGSVRKDKKEQTEFNPFKINVSKKVTYFVTLGDDFCTGQEINVNIPIAPSESKPTNIPIFVAAREEDIKDQVILIITHTSPLIPEETMTVIIKTHPINFKKLD
ncbi:hypothetical protein [Bartonella vinsonii]|uniref:Uncharacterized protein n=1 Tax=Bartonella vinsonii TaxID=33047 RepID=A0A3S5F8R5_BARVI|nr:hypothetical protein [Bartonella vinsonii]VEJ44384.1 Uncharacterised protein [Bartonella vinsonii]VEJ44938.1 Uncharacterised protein [Bartonella vinsonii]